MFCVSYHLSLACNICCHIKLCQNKINKEYFPKIFSVIHLVFRYAIQCNLPWICMTRNSLRNQCNNLVLLKALFFIYNLDTTVAAWKENMWRSWTNPRTSFTTNYKYVNKLQEADGTFKCNWINRIVFIYMVKLLYWTQADVFFCMSLCFIAVLPLL